MPRDKYIILTYGGVDMKTRNLVALLLAILMVLNVSWALGETTEEKVSIRVVV